jgi:hypothetical protein
MSTATGHHSISSTTLPPSDLLAEIARELSHTCRTAKDIASMHAFDHAAYALARGVQPLLSAGDLLIPSSRGRPIYRVSRSTCSCSAGRRGNSCWHAALAEVVALAWERLGAADDDDATPTVGAFGDPPRIDDVELPFVPTPDDFDHQRLRLGDGSDLASWSC